MVEKALSTPPFAALKAFEAYGRTGGIRSAAKLLGIDHAIVGRHLRRLEELVGTPLVAKPGGGLTASGQAYHARIATALREIARATSDLRPVDDRQLRLWCVPGFAYHWLAKRLGAFRATWPDIEVEFRTADQTPDFRIGEADADIRYIRDGYAAGLPAEVRAMTIARPPVFPVASPNVARRIASLSDLASATLLTEDNPDEWLAWLHARGIEFATPPTLSRLWHAHIALAAARDGQGIALANHYLLDDDLVSGRLVRVLPELTSDPPVVLGDYVFLVRKNQWEARPIARFRSWLVVAAQEAS